MRLILSKIVPVLVFVALMNIEVKAQKFHKIPTQILELYQLMGYEDYSQKDTVNEFQISDFILYKEYKKYLKSIEADSSEHFYISQLPDTNITIDTAVYREYITSDAYDNFPVLGISWDNAMNYCKWKTLEDNKKGKIKLIYRLPYQSEWLAALYHYDEGNIKNDVNDKYSEWTLNAFDESAYNFKWEISFDYIYMHNDTDPMVLKRKRVVGSSYLYHIADSRYGYSMIGYQYIAFRVVKSKVDKFTLKYWGIEE